MKEAFSKNIPKIFLVALVGATFFVWYVDLYFEARFNKTRVHVFDVGQGDGIFIEAPGRNQILIDGGPDKKILAKLGATMLPWDRSIDLLVLTHPHADHIDGLLEVLRRYRIGTVLESGAQYSIPEYAEWHRLLKEKNIPVVIAHAGEGIRGPDDFSMDILAPLENSSGTSPTNIHDAMVVSRMDYGSTSVLFMGDSEKILEYKLMYSGGKISADVLKAGHHGSKTSTSDIFLNSVNPKYAVISVGRKNRYGHPNQEVLERLQNFGVKVFRTDQDGDVVFISDGLEMRSEILGAY